MANLTRYTVLPDTGCWAWTGALNSQGYGSVSIGNGATALAHRASWEAANGSIPEGAQIDHTCHNADPECKGGDTCSHRKCINPDHLEPVTQSENLRRAYRTRAVRDECRSGHEMTPANIMVIVKADRREERACRECKRIARRRAYARKLEREGRDRQRRSRYAAPETGLVSN